MTVVKMLYMCMYMCVYVVTCYHPCGNLLDKHILHELHTYHLDLGVRSNSIESDSSAGIPESIQQILVHCTWYYHTRQENHVATLPGIGVVLEEVSSGVGLEGVTGRAAAELLGKQLILAG